MKKILFLLFFISGSHCVQAQVESPISWDKSFEINEDKSINLIFTATIKDGWHLYSQTLDPNEGPIPTSFKFKEAPGYELSGETIEGDPKVKYDTNFEMDIAMFDSTATFTQKILHTGKSLRLFGEISFMVCNDEQCIFPPEEEFTFTFTGSRYMFFEPSKSDD